MKSLITLLLLLAVVGLYAQDDPLLRGQKKVSIGFGLGSYLKLAGSKTTFPPVTASAEYAINESMTVGGIVGYTATEQNYHYPSLGMHDTYKLSHFLIGAQANYYFNINPRYEVYSGVVLGYEAVSFKVKTNSSYQSGTYDDPGGSVLFGFHLGGRYKFNDITAAFAELGYGIAVLTVGVTAAF